MKYTRYLQKSLLGVIWFLPAHLLLTPLEAVVLKQSMVYTSEENINGRTFKQVLERENSTKTESFYINGEAVRAPVYEEALLNAEKEESKWKRRKNQEERLARYETRYKGQVKIAQADLKKVIDQLKVELTRLDDERLKPYIIFSLETIASAEQLRALQKKLIPEAERWAQSAPVITDIKRVQDIRAELNQILPRVKDTFIATVNNGITMADDTTLLKEFLALL